MVVGFTQAVDKHNLSTAFLHLLQKGFLVFM
ncbi:hypothetical protein NT01CX_1371 [Clostridium novyi NT]|uniref:Uncharacterized protein n=1 Tax=Clostridium novyi (strain NT) TaxID=386415 RepID=A0PYK2_CLONN|nr:hypothetical protein NT01CX_1371 [Clostridium novyi NT]